LKTFCIKTNNKKAITFINKKLEKIKLDKVFVSNVSFALYKNIIVHYKGDQPKKFTSFISKILTECILYLYEKNLILSLINKNYFYFSDYEKEKIYEHYLQHSNESEYLHDKKLLIKSAVSKYFNENSKMILDGFVMFRLTDCIILLDEIIDLSVNSFLLEKEYIEFIYLLKVYIESKFPTLELVHFIYHNDNCLLLDQYLNVIPVNKDIDDIRYLSDITFCDNDYFLSTLLQISPQKLIIHCNEYDNDFINTLKLIFADRVEDCVECGICSIFIENNIL